MNKPKAPRLVTVIIFTTITTILWVFFGIYTILTQDATIDIDPKFLEPVSPSINTVDLENLPGRMFYEPGQTQPLQVNLEQSPTPTPTEAIGEEIVSEQVNEVVENEEELVTSPTPTPTQEPET